MAKSCTHSLNGNNQKQQKEGKRNSRKQEKRRKRKEHKIVQSERGNGECVFNSLLEGVIGMRRNSPTTHQKLVEMIKSYVGNQNGKLTVNKVLFNGNKLSERELKESVETLKNIHVGNGYLCAAQDPLLYHAAAAFNINIIHDFIETRFEFTVPTPLRTVYLRSSRGHMSHESNVEINQPS